MSNPYLDDEYLHDAGHDDVRVPQVRNLTVEDWNDGLQGYVGDAKPNASMFVSSNKTLYGNNSLEVASSEKWDWVYANTNDAVQSFPQIGDVFEFSTWLPAVRRPHFTVAVCGDDINARFAGNSYRFSVGSGDSQTLEITLPDGSTIESSDSLSQITGEWVDARCKIGYDTVGMQVVRQNGEVVSEISIQNTTPQVTDGAIGFDAAHGEGTTSSISLFLDLHDEALQRRSVEYFAETRKGTTQLGNEVTPTGAINTGPQEAPVNALRQEYARAPVNSDATQGDRSLLTLLKSGINPALYMERTMDGQGGAYGHQLQAALGRFARINANLSWEYDTLADVPNWTTSQNGSSGTFDILSRPRRISISHDGTGNDRFLVVESKILTTVDSLGPFRIIFEDVSYTQNSVNGCPVFSLAQDTNNRITIQTGFNNDSFLLRKLVDGTETSGTFASIDWSENHNIAIEYDGNEIQAVVDGTIKQTIPASFDRDFTPRFGLVDSDDDNTGETLEVEQVTVEPLPEVLQ